MNQAILFIAIIKPAINPMKPFSYGIFWMPKRFGGSPAENVKGQGSKSQDSGHDTNHLSDLAMIMNG